MTSVSAKHRGRAVQAGALREDVLSPLYEEEGQLLAHVALARFFCKPIDRLSGQMMDVDPVSPGTSSSVDAGAGPSNFGAHRVARRKLNELDTSAIIRDVKRSSDLPMAERLNVHQGVIARLINEVARLRGALQATKKKRARYGGDEDD
ncbi:uncharacterized protein B0H18DRAFT_956895 [Fomitopsis serialis]|uniref:uncharacterized protein n=1 Tax=Fomitopsis serialis TaxID=139415 RepID=UPI002007A92B|nr:uncharacterized protein B0H18DRAFT_956895 [Neoantrodia serialis]KAH9920759.1 hypothetical protein B0H18DRAFT_956895 [Neoantrodia serialis]